MWAHSITGGDKLQISHQQALQQCKGQVLAQALHCIIPMELSWSYPPMFQFKTLKGWLICGVVFSLGDHLRFHVYNAPCDMRKSFDGLSGLVGKEWKRAPLSGDVFVFINRRRTQIKLLHWESGGMVCYHKRLEQGTLAQVSKSGDKTVEISWRELGLLVDGIVVKKMIQRKRFDAL